MSENVGLAHIHIKHFLDHLTVDTWKDSLYLYLVWVGVFSTLTFYRSSNVKSQELSEQRSEFVENTTH